MQTLTVRCGRSLGASRVRSLAHSLTDDEVPGGGQHQGAGEHHAVEAEASRRRPQAAVVEQPDEAAAQAEVDGPAVGDDAVVTLRRQATATAE